ncbi:hypothetical protein JBE04_17070 [Streptomyces sp. PRKS01-29]|nr:hypothetical protein [Streptomyces sabulosicollis]MBI0296129.1 hypothetical protein [Streptomyces sabulosicollis]
MPISAVATAAEALRNSNDLARRTERFGWAPKPVAWGRWPAAGRRGG